MKRLTTTTHLEITAREQLRPAAPPREPCALIRAERPCPELNRFLYAAVGSRWAWYSRLAWSRARWLEYLDRPELETWIGYVTGTPVGYFELELQDEGRSAEIVYFGLLPDAIGRGLGGHLLTAAVCRAWGLGAERVWLHTCDLDHPSALPHYQARGFRVFHVETAPEDVPDPLPDPWPGY